MSEANRRVAPSGVPPLLHGRCIAIVGAGPAGLTLARLLQMRGADVRVYERDASRRMRGQGGSLDLHEDSGQLALRQAGLGDAFRARARPDGQCSRILDRHAVVQVETLAEHEAQSQPEIDRGALRNLLLDSLAPGTVIWDARLDGVERAEGGGWRLAFAPGEAVQGGTAHADLLFGCDGGWSRVRPLRSAAVPVYSGVTFVQARLVDADLRHPEIAGLVGSGSLMALGDDRALMAQRNGDGTIRVYAVLRVEESWRARGTYDWQDDARVRRDLLAQFSGWSPTLTGLLANAEPGFERWPLYCMPAAQQWLPATGATLLGDAAHIMPPFTGRGANHAMLDAFELAQRLGSDRFASIEAALADYESAMLARMAPEIEATLASQDLMIAPDAPAGIVAYLRGQTGE
ncbi:NAD(P)/FAD-dependent oxidoreductase [Burkholderia sp. A1]|uniref:FAD-dependent oxidoreductase n=1 Tax=Burkholderia sp. A1 TaxID=148446 RepID=UPI00068B8B57|nr:NAD(P)/FAD-dependent oxidoreductase [Burkholderia sp. A1]